MRPGDLVSEMRGPCSENGWWPKAALLEPFRKFSLVLDQMGDKNCPPGSILELELWAATQGLCLQVLGSIGRDCDLGCNVRRNALSLII